MKIKFRAWDKELKKWGNDLYIGQSGEMQRFHYNGTGVYSGLDLSEQDEFEYAKRFEVCMFTGLHDKNGKEIYEGDLLKSESMETIMPVKWFSESAGFHLAWIEGHRVEVIGNIYENPELVSDNASTR